MSPAGAGEMKPPRVQRSQVRWTCTLMYFWTSQGQHLGASAGCPLITTLAAEACVSLGSLCPVSAQGPLWHAEGTWSLHPRPCPAEPCYSDKG